MAHVADLLKPAELQKISNLQVVARLVVEGFYSGLHKSPHKGFSVEFAQHRQYVPGDEIRRLDWKVFGKTDKFYLKQYEEETNLVSHMLIDTSESMRYQSADAPLSKLEYAQCVAASLAYLILQQQDSVGLVTFDSEIRSLIRASANPSHLKQLLYVMENAEARRKTQTGPIFHDLAERLKRRGLVLILSDLFDDVPSMMAGLKHFRHRRHEVVVFHVLDPAELDFPFRQTTLFRGMEELPDVLTDPRALRRAYLDEFGKFLQAVRKGCRAQRIDYVLLRTDQSLEIALSSFLASRMHRVR